MVVKVQRNPSTGKVMRNVATGKVMTVEIWESEICECNYSESDCLDYWPVGQAPNMLEVIYLDILDCNGDPITCLNNIRACVPKRDGCHWLLEDEQHAYWDWCEHDFVTLEFPTGGANFIFGFTPCTGPRDVGIFFKHNNFAGPGIYVNEFTQEDCGGVFGAWDIVGYGGKLIILDPCA